MSARTKQAARKKLTKAELLNELGEAVGGSFSRRQVKDFYESLVEIAYRELRETGDFVLPGFARFTVSDTPARPAREGVNPFTGEPMTYAAKPASKAVKVKLVKAIKDAVS